MAFSGLIALLDDIATVADDVATLTVAAAKKSTGIVTDDMAVSAEQTMGIAREREIPVVMAVAWGSLRNKALILAPGALLLNAVAPWVIHPILMAGGTFLCFEGVEKILHKFLPHDEHGDGHASDEPSPELDPVAYEKTRVSGAIRTDLILSGEIIALTLGGVADKPFVTQAGVLYGVSVILTVGVYGLVAGLVKLDDLGEYLVRSGGGRQGLGRAILWFAPWLLHAIAWIGTFAMLMVGGHILLEGIHALEEPVHHFLHELPELAAFFVGLLIDIAIGAVAGGIVVGLFATGVPGRLWAMIPKPGAKAS